jgi:hypothetical protein
MAILMPTLRLAIFSLLCLQFPVASAAPPPPGHLWSVWPPLDYTDPLYCGWDQIPVVKEVEIYNGVAHNRTYAHHPELYAVGNKVFLLFSSAPVDEDSMGQDVWISTSMDGGITWTPSTSLFPAALLPNQTDPLNYAYWCERGIAQRAWQANTFIHLPNGELYAIAQSGSRWCPSAFKTAGRIARQISLDGGKPLGDPCWLEKNEYTDSQEYSKTIYGTKYGMKMCKKACQINAVLREPDTTPAWTSWLYNNLLFAADGAHSMQENTFAVWINDTDSPTGGYWQRHWRDISSGTAITHAVWVEYNEEPSGKGWYPKVLAPQGNKIFQTTIPDAGTKQFLGQLGNGNRYLLSNPKFNATAAQRQPLTLAVSRGTDQRYTAIGVLRTDANPHIVPDTRNGVKDHAFGFSYPTAVQVGNNLIAAYSENKENIWISVVDIEAFPEDRNACVKDST